ncbi:hypothetical protein F5876DRAFT_63085 [Lentinula aff. lateritia]|uniref:Uncharacterized protein n=1 Tax=Lentinula aff. lateritia TaxID=2804960 RepID=A0ACC1U9K6_9AGAR|nr:hypothetical protein F5876DRAFT_63085 [Lentinula aff. lateritia]
MFAPGADIPVNVIIELLKTAVQSHRPSKIIRETQDILSDEYLTSLQVFLFSVKPEWAKMPDQIQSLGQNACDTAADSMEEKKFFLATYLSARKARALAKKYRRVVKLSQRNSTSLELQLASEGYSFVQIRNLKLEGLNTALKKARKNYLEKQENTVDPSTIPSKSTGQPSANLNSVVSPHLDEAYHTPATPVTKPSMIYEASTATAVVYQEATVENPVLIAPAEMFCCEGATLPKGAAIVVLHISSKGMSSQPKLPVSVDEPIKLALKPNHTSEQGPDWGIQKNVDDDEKQRLISLVRNLVQVELRQAQSATETDSHGSDNVDNNLSSSQECTEEFKAFLQAALGQDTLGQDAFLDSDSSGVDGY